MKRALIALILCSIYFLSACSSKPLDQVPPLKIAMDPHIGVPFAYKTADDQYGGFEVELAHYIAKKLNRELQIIEVDWDQLQTTVRKKKAELALSAIERPMDNVVPEGLAYTAHYYTAFQQLAVRTEDKFTYNLSDLKKKKVGVVDASVGALLLLELNRIKHSEIEIMTFETPEAVIEALIQKKIAASLTERAVASWYSWKNKEIRLTGEPISSEIPYVGLVSSDNSELLQEINRILQTAGEDPEFRAIFDKWHVSIQR